MRDQSFLAGQSSVSRFILRQECLRFPVILRQECLRFPASGLYIHVMATKPRAKLDLDSPWKEALLRYLPFFLRFFFPHVYDAIDWSRGYESLDKELRRIMPESDVSNRLADMLFKVWLK